MSFDPHASLMAEQSSEQSNERNFRFNSGHQDGSIGEYEYLLLDMKHWVVGIYVENNTQ